MPDNTLRFAEKLTIAQQRSRSTLALLLAPRLPQLPFTIQQFDDPLLPFAKAIIDATRDLVCAYVFDFAAYLVPGASGAVALERTIRYANGETITILHGPFAGGNYHILLDETSFGVDALTLTNGLDLNSYLQRPDRSAFIVRSGYGRSLDVPGTGGFFWIEDGLFKLMGLEGQPLEIRLIGAEALYAGKGEDFAQQTRAVLEKLRA